MNYIGIDIGGTNIKAALTDHSGLVRKTTKAPTIANDLGKLIATIKDLVTELQSGASVSGVGVGIPGLRSVRTHVIQSSPHIPCIRGVNFEDALGKALSLPVITENDANAGAYGEWACGAGKGIRHMVYVTLGTGLGCGLIIDGKLLRGTSGYAGELGHNSVELEGRPCACGSHGCVETRVSATGVVITAKMRDPERHVESAEALYNAAIQGDAMALDVFEETGRYLGMVCANVINLLNPEVIVIGGGVMAAGALLLKAAKDEAVRRAFAPSAADCTIVQSHLWPDAGTIGAAMLARDSS